MRGIVKISIQSISDIITNSSSEVFPVVAKYGIEDDLYEIIDAILDAGKSSLTSRELFDIKSDWGSLQIKPKINTLEVTQAANALECLESLFESSECEY